MKVYLCGGINGLLDTECIDWREAAKQLLTDDTIDPMRRDYRGKEDENVVNIVKGDLQDIMESDVVLVNATRPSWGTAMEIVYSRTMCKHIVAFTGLVSISPWLRYHCNKMFTTVEEACGYINATRNL